ncbi:hypothetical protein FACS1894163_10010 [Spirochaetia bacterium]|nr:hypothetical protein FACS1894163_10010 [Spirochaetia bacterium]
MKRFFLILAIFKCGVVYSQINVADGAIENFKELLNNPQMIASKVTDLNRRGGWVLLETDFHVFTDASFAQVTAVMGDYENYKQYINGKRIRISCKIVKITDDERLINFTTTTISGPFKFVSNFDGIVKYLTSSPLEKILTITQTDKNNKKVNAYFAVRYVKEVTIDGKKYTYIRLYNKEEVKNSIISDELIRKESIPVNIETLELIALAAAKK